MTNDEQTPDEAALAEALARASFSSGGLVPVELPPSEWLAVLALLQGCVRNMRRAAGPNRELRLTLADAARMIEIELGAADAGLVEFCRRGWHEELFLAVRPAANDE